MPAETVGGSSCRPEEGALEPEPDLEAWLAALEGRLDLDRERRMTVIAEVRSHVLDAVDDYRARGLDRRASLRRAWRDLGPQDRLAAELAEAHAGGATVDALRMVVLPVLLALVLRFGVLTLDGRMPDSPTALTMARARVRSTRTGRAEPTPRAAGG